MVRTTEFFRAGGLAAWLALAVFCVDLPGQTATVDAKANIFAAGRAEAVDSGGGIAPIEIRLPQSGGRVVRFPAVSGRITCDGGDYVGPEGGACAGGDTDVESLNGVAGIVHHGRSMFLVGVFLDQEAPSGEAPERLDFTENGSFEALSPQLRQVFFIGDGKSGEGSGTVQRFQAPPGATRLFLGIADAPAFQGQPGTYEDNSGTLSVNYEFETVSIVNARANIFASGRASTEESGGGVLPVLVPLPAGTGRVMSFPSVAGRWSCDGEVQGGPDGGNDCAGGDTDISSLEGIAGIIHHGRSMFLVGVFLGAGAPPSPAPERLDFTGNDGFETLAPAVGQVFFIGDGRRGEAPGTPQRFRIPDGATRLYLGVADAWGFQGEPGAYDDNTGFVTVQHEFGTGSYHVDAKANLFAAGRATTEGYAGGVLPFEIKLPAGTGRVIRFPNVAGEWTCDGEVKNGPEGGTDCAGGSTDIQSAHGIAGIIHRNRSMFLAGVFLGPAAPSLPAPARLDFTLNDSFATLSPGLGQIFFVGDGKTGRGSGSTQEFRVPDGATRLFLGVADAFGFQGEPGAYDDNTGGVTAAWEMPGGQR